MVKRLRRQLGFTFDPHAQLRRVLDYVRVGQEEGAGLVGGGERLTGDGHDRGHFMRPAVFTGLTPGMRLTQEEVFGPVLGFQRASSLDEAIELANGTDYGLAAGLVTRDLGQALAFARRVTCGVVKVNQPTTGVSMTVPFGGLKASSTQTFKEQAGHAMMRFYTQEKSVYLMPGN